MADPSKPVAWTWDDLVLLEWAEQNKDQVDALREALDDLWACIPNIDDLQPETVAIAKDNHERLWHS